MRPILGQPKSAGDVSQETARDDGRSNLGIVAHGAGKSHILRQNEVEERFVVAALKWQLAGDHLVRDNTHAPPDETVADKGVGEAVVTARRRPLQRWFLPLLLIFLFLHFSSPLVLCLSATLCPYASLVSSFCFPLLSSYLFNVSLFLPFALVASRSPSLFLSSHLRLYSSLLVS